MTKDSIVFLGDERQSEVLDDEIFLKTKDEKTKQKLMQCRSYVIKFNNGRIWLINCGDGTQSDFMNHQLAFNRVDVILITKMTPGRVLGLPGFIAMLLYKKCEPQQIIYVMGPTGMRKWLLEMLNLTDTFFKKLQNLHIIESHETHYYQDIVCGNLQSLREQNNLPFNHLLGKDIPYIKLPQFKKTNWYIYAFSDYVTPNHVQSLDAQSLDAQSLDILSQLSKATASNDASIFLKPFQKPINLNIIYVLIEASECKLDTEKVLNALQEYAKNTSYHRMLASMQDVTLPNGKVVSYSDVMKREENCIRCHILLPSFDSLDNLKIKNPKIYEKLDILLNHFKKQQQNQTYVDSIVVEGENQRINTSNIVFSSEGVKIPNSNSLPNHDISCKSLHTIQFDVISPKT